MLRRAEKAKSELRDMTTAANQDRWNEYLDSLSAYDLVQMMEFVTRHDMECMDLCTFFDDEELYAA